MASPGAQLDALLTHLITLPTSYEKIKTALGHQIMQQAILSYIKTPEASKNPALFQQGLAAGDQHVRDDEFFEAIDQYNLAIALIPEPYGQGMDTLAVTLNRRAAVWERINYPFRAFLDKVAVLRYHAPSAQNWPSLAMIREELVKFTRTETITLNLSSDLAVIGDRLCIHPLMRGESPWSELPDDIFDDSADYMAPFFEVKTSTDRGRYMVTREAITKNTVVFDTQIYSAGVRGNVDYFICHHCLDSLQHRNFPCRRCTQVSYCSERCADHDWPYHEFTCLFLKIFYGMKLLGQPIAPDRMQMVLNAVTRVGFKRAVKLSADRNAARSKEDQKFVQVLNFHKPYDVIVDKDKKEFVFLSALLTFMFNYYGLLPPGCDTEAQATQLGAVLHEVFVLQHVNNFGTTVELEVGNNDQAYFTDEVVIAMTMVIACTLVNHSCVPNVAWKGVRRRQVARTLKNVAAGEEINASYGVEKGDPAWPYTRRRKVLFGIHGFICQCQGCVEEEQVAQARAQMQGLQVSPQQ